MNFDCDQTARLPGRSPPELTDGFDEDRILTAKSEIDSRLANLLKTDGFVPKSLDEAMRYALLGEGKRIRPLLMTFMAPLGSDRDVAIDIGCAVEMIHTASLILDDLPCMDDADLRRHRPATHVKFGQSTAILAAIALLTRGMSVISSCDGLAAETRSKLVAILSDAVGHTGLAAGQELDVSGTGQVVAEADVERLNWLKTGKLFVAVAEMASLIAPRPDAEKEALVAFARHLGLAFQTQDDILDTTSVTEDVGKDVGKDNAKQRLVSLLGTLGAQSSWQNDLRMSEEALLKSGADAAPIRIIVRQCFGLDTRTVRKPEPAE